ncbi:phytoene desaturase [candidate division KSB1 bacterium]|nr:phytoene desaturase [candidate division KSB1 bacterium]NIR73435.1 phytoene desaturase [candidate division KSB1 bacterium]NIS28426.1 phytoene desaturase [candidate division KSB1 bacterium]NIT75306.1 phytoene desaturase [candidate division KSB1 bacterium]NIU29154.1 phytoene desaturase [candidate division KSB1 bacterium]
MKRIAVIGSGFSSLAAASVLAAKGCRVTVYEKNKTLGGRARTFSADGFTFDMGPSWYWMPDVFDSYFDLFGKKISDYYELKLLDPSYRVFFEDNNVLHVPASLDALYGLFDSIEKNGGVRLKQFLREAAYKYEVGMQNLVYKPGQSLVEFLDRDFLKGLFRMHVLQSFHRYVRKYFKDPKLIRIMEFPVLFLGGMPRNTPALYSLMSYAGLSLGTWYPMGGMSKVIAAMVTLASSLGVEFQTDVEISKIAVRDNLTRGVHCNGQFFAADAVVAGADYHHVEQNLLAPEYRTYDPKYWSSRVMAPSSLIFYLGVNKKINNLQHHNLFFDEDFDSHIQDIYGQPRWPNKPLFYVCCPSKTDPTVAPRGSENLFVLIPIAAGLNDDEEIRHKYFELVITRLEKLIGQQFKDNIIFQRSYCLKDFKKDYHAFKGNAYGLANTLKQTAVFKPSMRSKKVENLFFSGQLTVPGPGVPPSLISGQVAARQALNYLNGD